MVGKKWKIAIAAILVAFAFLFAFLFLQMRPIVICLDERRVTVEMGPTVESIFEDTPHEYKDVNFSDYYVHLVNGTCDVVMDISPTQEREEVMLFSKEVKDDFFFAFRKGDQSLKEKVDLAIDNVNSQSQ